MDEYEINELRDIINKVDTYLIHDENPSLELLKKLVKTIDNMDFEDHEDLSNSHDDKKERLHVIYHTLDKFDDAIQSLEQMKEQLLKFEEAMKLLDIKSKNNIDSFLKTLEKLHDVYDTIELESGD